MPYTPPFIKQLDGSRFAGTNCTVASSCMAAIRHRRGSNPAGTAPWYPYPSWVRAVMGDTSGGTNLQQNYNVFFAKYSIAFFIKYRQTWTEFRNFIKAGRGAILQGSYDVVLPTVFDASGTFTGNHAVYVNAVRWNSTRGRYEFQVGDPLADGRRTGIPRGYQWWPEALLRSFAGRLVVGSSRLGVGYVYAMFTKDTETTTTTTSSVTLRYGGMRMTARNVYAKYDGVGVWSQPSTKSTRRRLVRVNGLVFKRYQKTWSKLAGGSVGGSNTWFGDYTGTSWVPYSRVRF